MKKNRLKATLVAGWEMKVEKLLLIAFVLMGTSCGNKQTEVSDGLVYDSLSVKVDYPYLSDYASPRPFYRNDTLYASAYNHLTHSYDFISLSDSGRHFSISLQMEGKDGVDTASDIFDMQTGILTKEQVGFKCMDDSGHVLAGIPLTEVRDSASGNLYSIQPHGMLVGGYRHAAFDSIRREIIFPLHPSDALPLRQRLLGGKVCVDNGKFSFLPVHYPEQFGDESLNVGSFFIPQFTVCDDRIIYNFHGYSKFWVLPASGGSVMEYDMPSRYTDNQSPVPSASKNIANLFREELLALHFCEVYYVKGLHCYVRVHHAPKKERKAPLVSYLMLMDEDGKHLQEYPLPESFTGKYFVTGREVYFFMFTADGDNEMRLARIRLADYID